MQPDVTQLADDAVRVAVGDGHTYRRAEVEQFVGQIAADHGPDVVAEIAVMLALLAGEAVTSYCTLQGTPARDLDRAAAEWLDATSGP